MLRARNSAREGFACPQPLAARPHVRWRCGGYQAGFPRAPCVCFGRLGDLAMDDG